MTTEQVILNSNHRMHLAWENKQIETLNAQIKHANILLTETCQIGRSYKNDFKKIISAPDYKVETHGQDLDIIREYIQIYARNAKKYKQEVRNLNRLLEAQIESQKAYITEWLQREV